MQIKYKILKFFILNIILLCSSSFLSCLYSQSFPELNFSVPDAYEFEVTNIQELENNLMMVTLVSNARTVENLTLIQIHYIETALESIPVKEFLKSYKEDYDSKCRGSRVFPT